MSFWVAFGFFWSGINSGYTTLATTATQKLKFTNIASLNTRVKF